MKQVFFEELDDLNVSLSQNRKEKLYQYWLLLQQHYIMEDEENFEEWCNVLKEYFYKSIEYDPSASLNTYFELIYGFLNCDNLWHDYETKLMSCSYYDAYNWMYQNRKLVISNTLNTKVVLDAFLARAQELYVDFMAEEMVGAYPEYSKHEDEIFDDFMFLIRYYPNLPKEIFYDNMNYEMLEKQLYDLEKLSYLFGMCHHDITCMSTAYWGVVTPKRLEQEKRQYYHWLKNNSYNDILINQFVEQGIEEQAYRLTKRKQKIKHIVKE